ncbi:MAG TPA: Coq4 family protein [Caulobacteraceae bacterium]|nr:Coq4 family protein [Caulobacteraceae bacterium]
MSAAETLAIDARRRPARQGLTPRRAFRIQPVRAMKALRRLMNDKEDTAAVFELMRALSGRAVPKGYARLLKSEEGGRIAYERDEFAERLSDGAWLAGFGPGTVGAAYRDFIAPRGLSAQGLAEESRKVEDTQIDAAHPFAWYGRRMRDVHDVWHVLTGYGTNALGEACLVAFSYRQTKSLGFAVIARAAQSRMRAARTRLLYAAAVDEGFRNGRRAAWLPAVDYPALFGENLEEARARLEIARPVVYESIPEGARNPLRA